MPSTTLPETAHATARGVLESVAPGMIVLAVPGTDYRLHLVPTAAPMAPVGKRMTGTISAKALRMFKASGGGRFIEPVIGQPRIVAGQVLAVDQANRRALVDVSVPMWLTFEAKQHGDVTFSVGDLVNCYVESGAAFTPAS